MIHNLLDFLFPNPCVCCLKPAGRNRFLCPACEKAFSFYPVKNTCKTCLAPIPAGADICGQCLALKPAYAQLVVCVSYSGSLRTALHSYKFYGRTDLAASFSLMLTTQLRRLNLTDFHAVIPIPLSRERLKQRGFNQSELIAKLVAKEFDVPCISDALIRRRDTKQQAALHKGQRSKNVRGAFDLQDADALRSMRVLLVDDIFTSGATMREAAKTLSASVSSVVACAIAKTSIEKDQSSS